MKQIRLAEQEQAAIRQAVDQLCRRLDEPDAEVEDFREEMTANLQSSVYELMEQGNEPERAIQIALERFGEPESLLRELNDLYRVRRVFAKGLLRIACAMGIVGVVCMLLFYVWNHVWAYKSANQWMDNIRAEYRMDQLAGDEIPEVLLQKVADAVEDSQSIDAGGVRVIDFGKEVVPPFLYAYPSPEAMEVRGSGEFVAYSTFFSTQIRVDDQGRAIEIVLKQRLLAPGLSLAGICLIFGYWILFAVWASLNVAQSGKRYRSWVFVFAVTNVLGYMGYYWIQRRKGDSK